MTASQLDVIAAKLRMLCRDCFLFPLWTVFNKQLWTPEILATSGPPVEAGEVQIRTTMKHEWERLWIRSSVNHSKFEFRNYSVSNRSPDIRSVTGLQLLVELLMISDNFHLISYLISLLFQCVEKNWDKSELQTLKASDWSLSMVSSGKLGTWSLKIPIGNFELETLSKYFSHYDRQTLRRRYCVRSRFWSSEPVPLTVPLTVRLPSTEPIVPKQGLNMAFENRPLFVLSVVQCVQCL